MFQVEFSICFKCSSTVEWILAKALTNAAINHIITPNPKRHTLTFPVQLPVGEVRNNSMTVHYNSFDVSEHNHAQECNVNGFSEEN